MSDMHGYVVLATKVLADKPASGATVTLYDSTANGAKSHGSRFKLVVINIISSANSAANGIVISESSDKGATWDVSDNSSAYATASGYVKTVKKVSAPDFKIDYINSAATLTTWRVSILGDRFERSNG